MAIALLVLRPLVGGARARVELAARQRRRHADDADIGAFGQRIDRLPVGIDARAQRLEILDAAYVVLERERGGLGRVDDRSAAEDRKSVVKGKSVSVRVDLGGRRQLKKKNHNNTISKN